jgi:hypothetical protein
MASRGGGRNRTKDAPVPDGRLTGSYPASTEALVLRSRYLVKKSSTDEMRRHYVRVARHPSNVPRRAHASPKAK